MNQQHLITRSNLIPLTALGVLVYMLALAVWMASLPSDGWLYAQDPETGRVIFIRKLTDAPSPLQVGDELLAAEGYTATQIDSAIYTFNPPHSENWVDGGTVQYTVLRAEQELTLDVPLRRLTPAEVVHQFWVGGLSSLPPFAFLLVGIIALAVFMKQPRHLAAQLLLLVGAGLTGNAFAFFSAGLVINFTHWTMLNTLINPWPIFVFSPLTHLLLVFPVQKRILRTHAPLTLALVYLTIPVITLFLGTVGTLLQFSNQSILINVFGGLLVTLFPLVVILPSLVHTFRTVHEPMARAQARWLGVGIVGLIVLTNIGWIVPSAGGSEWFWLVNVAGWVMLPVCLGVAILRYRLWEIDILIRRTLQYSVLTGLLVLIYFGGVVIFQGIFSSLTGISDSPVIIVLSTLAIAALFNPLRRRVQDFIDRRFYRKKYNAEQALAQFAAIARDEVDMDKLATALIGVVQETMQPEKVSLWLMETVDRKLWTTDSGLLSRNSVRMEDQP